MSSVFGNLFVLFVLVLTVDPRASYSGLARKGEKMDFWNYVIAYFSNFEDRNGKHFPKEIKS